MKVLVGLLIVVALVRPTPAPGARVLTPAAPAAGPPHLGLAHSFTGGQGSEVLTTLQATILVLEENAAVQELIDQTLRDSGHRVLSTKNSLEALEVVRKVRIDVLVAGDLLDGRRREVVDELCSIQPGLGVVSIFGPDDDLVQTGLSARLCTPVSLDELRAVVAARLDHGL